MNHPLTASEQEYLRAVIATTRELGRPGTVGEVRGRWRPDTTTVGGQEQILIRTLRRKGYLQSGGAHGAPVTPVRSVEGVALGLVLVEVYA